MNVFMFININICAHWFVSYNTINIIIGIKHTEEILNKIFKNGHKDNGYYVTHIQMGSGWINVTWGNASTGLLIFQQMSWSYQWDNWGCISWVQVEFPMLQVFLPTEASIPGSQYLSVRELFPQYCYLYHQVSSLSSTVARL